MLYKPFRSSLNNSILYGGENQGKKITIQQEKLTAGTLPESPLQGLCKVIWQDYSFWLEELMAFLTLMKAHGWWDTFQRILY